MDKFIIQLCKKHLRTRYGRNVIDQRRASVVGWDQLNNDPIDDDDFGVGISLQVKEEALQAFRTSKLIPKQIGIDSVDSSPVQRNLQHMENMEAAFEKGYDTEDEIGPFWSATRRGGPQDQEEEPLGTVPPGFAGDCDTTKEEAKTNGNGSNGGGTITTTTTTMDSLYHKKGNRLIPNSSSGSYLPVASRQ